MIAFCTVLDSSRSTTRSKELICDISRLPAKRRPTSRKTYTASVRSVFSRSGAPGVRRSVQIIGGEGCHSDERRTLVVIPTSDTTRCHSDERHPLVVIPTSEARRNLLSFSFCQPPSKDSRSLASLGMTIHYR